MTRLYDDNLHLTLSAWKIQPLAPGFTEALIQNVTACPQKRGLAAVFKQQLVEVAYDLFGRSYNWRLAGALTMVLIGFASGYMSESSVSSYDDSDRAALYELDDTEWTEMI